MADRAVALCVDAGFRMPLAVALRSLADKVPGDVDVHVVTLGIDDAMWRTIVRGLPDTLCVIRHEADEPTGTMPIHGHVSIGAYLRLYLPDILPPSLERVLYIDADVIALHDLAPLLESDLFGAPLAAVRDQASLLAGGPLSIDGWDALGLDPRRPYFNSGVMVIDLEQWRSEAIHREVLQVADEHAGHLRWWDQCALNIHLGGRWTELHPRWNAQTASLWSQDTWAAAVLGRDVVVEARQDPAIVHFTSNRKPWTGARRLLFADRWFELLDETAFAGWRPGRGARRVALQRLRAMSSVARYGYVREAR